MNSERLFVVYNQLCKSTLVASKVATDENIREFDRILNCAGPINKCEFDMFKLLQHMYYCDPTEIVKFIKQNNIEYLSLAIDFLFIEMLGLDKIITVRFDPTLQTYIINKSDLTNAYDGMIATNINNRNNYSNNNLNNVPNNIPVEYPNEHTNNYQNGYFNSNTKKVAKQRYNKQKLIDRPVYPNADNNGSISTYGNSESSHSMKLRPNTNRNYNPTKLDNPAKTVNTPKTVRTRGRGGKVASTRKGMAPLTDSECLDTLKQIQDAEKSDD